MISVTINGEKEQLNDTISLAALLERRNQGAGVAVAVNGEFVPRSEYPARLLKEGDQIEVVAPMQGG